MKLKRRELLSIIEKIREAVEERAREREEAKAAEAAKA